MSTAECGGAHEGKGEEEPAQTLLWSTDFTVQSVVFSCSTGVQNQKERPKNQYNSSPWGQSLLNSYIADMLEIIYK